MLGTTLDFEAPIAELRKKIEELQKFSDASNTTRNERTQH